MSDIPDIHGATGRFPKGKLCPEDNGEIRFRVGMDQARNVVVLDFGTPVVWLGMEPDLTRHLAARLNRAADELEKRQHEQSGPDRFPD